MSTRRIPMMFAVAMIALAGSRASAQGNTLEQARTIYETVASSGGIDRVSLEMARARASIDAADSAKANGHDQATADAMATQALHDAQAADAANSRIHDRQVADSLHAYRLSQLVALSQRQRDELFKQNQLSHAEIVDLRAQNLLTVSQSDSLRLQLDSLRAAASAQELSAHQQDSARVLQTQIVRQQDSLRIAQAAANEVRSSANHQTDSLRAVADRAQRQVDSIRYANAQASRVQTEAERLRTDSLQRAARLATHGSGFASAGSWDAARTCAIRFASAIPRAPCRSWPRGSRTRCASRRRWRSRRVPSKSCVPIRYSARPHSRHRSRTRCARPLCAHRRSETMAERQRSDSLRRLSELANARLDSLRRSAAQTQRQRDSVQALASMSAKQVDSLRTEAASATRTRDSLRADVEGRTKLSASVSTLSRTATTLRTPTLSPRGLVVTIGDASFVNGATAASAHTLTKIATRDLGRLTPAIAEYANYHVIVEGHADSTARGEKGDALADARAQAVRDALVSRRARCGSRGDARRWGTRSRSPRTRRSPGGGRTGAWRSW